MSNSGTHLPSKYVIPPPDEDKENPQWRILINHGEMMVICMGCPRQNFEDKALFDDTPFNSDDVGGPVVYSPHGEYLDQKELEEHWHRHWFHNHDGDLK